MVVGHYSTIYKPTLTTVQSKICTVFIQLTLGQDFKSRLGYG
jgi:hypothetical protein